MPYITESDSAGETTYVVDGSGYSPMPITLPSGRARVQTGYRSGPLSREERIGIQSRSARGKWADTRSHIADLDELSQEYSYAPDRQFSVHPRTYRETTFTPATGSWSGDILYNGAFSTTEWSDYAIGFTSANPTFPNLPGDSALRGKAGALMRQSMPAKPDFNIARAIGESREAHLLFRAGNYLPQRISELGGSYLNYVFGIQPTVSDLKKACETVINLAPIVEDYVSHNKRVLRRSGSETLSSTFVSGGGAYFKENSLPFTTTVADSQAVLKTGRIMGTFHTSNRSRVTIRWDYHRTQTLHTFASFEYFVTQASGLRGRLQRYQDIATRILGGGVDASTVYDLSRWTWLANFFVDMGGTLRYQQAVSDHSVIASRCGFTVNEELLVSATVSHWVDPAPYARFTETLVTDRPAIATVREFRSQRFRGSPYNMSPDWDFSSSQWAILGALGLSRVPRIGI